MNDKSSAKPQTASPVSPGEKMPTKPSAPLPAVKTPAKSKSGGGFFTFLMSLAALSVSAYLYLMIEKPELLGMEKTTAASHYTGRIDELERRLDNLSKNTSPQNAEDEEKIQQLEAQQQRLHQRINEALAENPHDLMSPASQLQFIDLGLRATGDAAVAVAALRRIKTSNPAAIAEEISRLENIPNRERILMQIAELRQLIAGTDEDQPEALDGAVLSLFNIRKIKSGEAVLLHQELTQMEFLFISNRKADYLQTLAEAAITWRKTAGDAPNPNISALFDLLKEYGLPDYRLQLRFEEF